MPTTHLQTPRYPSMNLPAGFVARFAEGFQKTPAILIILANRLASISPVHHMVDCSRVLHS
jgi:hypothetical protein